MRAIRYTAFGGPEAMELVDIAPLPAPQGRQVKVAVKASSVNPIDIKIRSGALDVGISPPAIPGFDAAGVVTETGPAVTDFRVGDCVFYAADFTSPTGTHAEEHLVDERIISRMPDSLTFTEAAVLPLAGGTAWDALTTLYPLKKSDSLLIHGGAGGVGSLAVQVALACGAQVFCTCHSSMVPHLEALGVSRAIAYDRQDFVEEVLRYTPGGLDLVYDTVGRRLPEQSIACLKDFGSLISIAPPAGNLDKAYRKNLTFKFQFSLRERRKLEGLAALAAEGALQAPVFRTFALGGLSDAHALLSGGEHIFGKIVIDHSL